MQAGFFCGFAFVPSGFFCEQLLNAIPNIESRRLAIIAIGFREGLCEERGNHLPRLNFGERDLIEAGLGMVHGSIPLHGGLLQAAFQHVMLALFHL